MKKTDLNRALNLIDLLEQDSIKEARPGLDRYKESITKQYNAHKEAEAEQNKRDALEVEKSPDIIVTTCDLKQEYEVIAPVRIKGAFRLSRIRKSIQLLRQATMRIHCFGSSFCCWQ